ncbi:unnamed protein product, partial [Nesidiocoris tenuis]
MSVELQKANLEGSNANTAAGNGSAASGTSAAGNGNPSPVASALPLAQLLTKPGALNALTSLTALSGLTDLLGGLTGSPSTPIQTTGVHRNKPFARMREGASTQADLK